MFFLPPDGAEMNPLAGEGHQLKTYEMAGQMFDNADDLAVAVDVSIPLIPKSPTNDTDTKDDY